MAGDFQYSLICIIFYFSDKIEPECSDNSLWREKSGWFKCVNKKPVCAAGNCA